SWSPPTAPSSAAPASRTRNSSPPVHPHQALARYRREVNPRAKLVVVGMTATNFSIADPADAGMLDVAGFDAAVPSLLADFATAA
ncbi:hypothetical protein ACFWFQ_30710, partial [Nocardia salmonicida]